MPDQLLLLIAVIGIAAVSLACLYVQHRVERALGRRRWRRRQPIEAYVEARLDDGNYIVQLAGVVVSPHYLGVYEGDGELAIGERVVVTWRERWREWLITRAGEGEA